MAKKAPPATATTSDENADFELELARILKRAERIKALLSGDATVTRFWREGHSVKKHDVKGHYVIRIGVKK